MDHNEFDFNEDLIKPFRNFLKQCKINVDIDDSEFEFPDDESDVDWNEIYE